MAVEPYRSRVSPSGAAALPMARPGMLSGIGEGIEGLGSGVVRAGEELQRQEAERKRVADNAELIRASRDMERVRQETEAEAQRLEAGTDGDHAPDWTGHRERLVGFYQQRAAAVLGAVQGEETRGRLSLSSDQYRGDLAQRAGAFEAGKRLKAIGDDWKTGTADVTGRAYFATTPEQWADMLTDAETIGRGVKVAPEIQDALIRERREAISEAIVNGMNDRGETAQARALMGDPARSGLVLDADFIKTALREGGVIDRRNQAEAEARLAVKKAEARTEIDLVTKQLRDGVPQTRETVKRVGELIKVYGLAEQGYDVAKLVTQADVVSETRGMLPQQIRQRLSLIETRIARAGDKAKPEDVWTRDALADQLATRSTQIDTDPYAFASQNGMAVAAIVPSDPATFAKRRQAQAALSRATGRPVPFFRPEEVADLAAQARSGPQGRAGVAGLLAAIDGPEAMAAAEQIAPKDDALRHAIDLSPALRVEMFEGEKLLGGNAALVSQRDSRERWTARAATALGELPASYRTGVETVARNLYAYRAAKRGLTEFDPAAWDDAVNDAIDPTGRGGIGQWNGRAVKLPYGMTQAEFETRLSRAPRIDGAFYANREPIPTAVLKRDYVPVAAQTSGAYGWKHKRSGAWALNARGGRAQMMLAPQR